MRTADVAGGVGSEAEVTAPDVVCGITARVTRRSLRTSINAAGGRDRRTRGRRTARDGVEPADVDEVIMTHAHASHVGGLLTGGQPTFARARHHLSRAEHDFWLGPAPQERLFPSLAEAMVATARLTFRPSTTPGLLELRRTRVRLTFG